MRMLPLGVILTGTVIGGTIGGGVGYLVGMDHNDVVGFWSLGAVVGTQMGFDFYESEYHNKI